MSPRTSAIKVLQQVIKRGKRLDESLLTDQTPLAKELSYGVLRFYYQLQAIALLLLEKPIKEKDHDVFLVILVGIYQLRFLKIKEHAAINETVNSAEELNKPWAKNLINAILRSYQRQNEFYLTEAAHYSHPNWIINQTREAWPQKWQDILEANNQHPPLTLRINQQQIKVEDYLKRDKVASLKAKAIKNIASAVCIEPTAVEKIPGFSSGEVSVQDAGAQFAPSLLKLEPELNILDACAAPGGKTAHILEKEPSSKLTVIDINKTRLNKVKQNLNRLSLSAKLIHTDATQTENWWDQKLFDRILVDAPCSGSGVIRRHPDIKLLRRQDDLAKFQAQQIRLLEKLWPTLKQQGYLLYITCSVFPAENDAVIQKLLARTKDAKVSAIKLPCAQATEYGQQLLPTPTNDGFYYCLLQKVAQ